MSVKSLTFERINLFITRERESRPISRVLSRTAIHLCCTSPYTFSDLPGSGMGHALLRVVSTRKLLPYLVLLRMGFTLPPMLPPVRCALTTPFHPYHITRSATGGIFSVALSVDSHPPGVTWHPARWSPDFPPRRSLGAATVWPTLTHS